METTKLIDEIRVALQAAVECSSEQNLEKWKAFFPRVYEIEEEVRATWKYSEPGYSHDSTEVPILFADWNKPLLAAFCDLTELVGGSIEWSDEWETCSDCEGAVRHSPDCYQWKKYSVMIGDETVCGNCLLEDPEAYLLAVAGKADHAITIDGINPEDHGYAIVNSEPFEYGLYGGQSSSPIAIFNCLKTKGLDKTAVFKIVETSQFCVTFTLYVEEADVEEARTALAEGNTRAELDPRVALERGLKAAAVAVKEGATHVTVHLDDGTASVNS